MLVVTPGEMADTAVATLPEWLRPGDLLVFNDIEVLPARLAGRRSRAGVEAGVEVTLLRDLGAGRWQALARPLRRLRGGDRIEFGPDLSAEVVGLGSGRVELDFSLEGAEFRTRLAAVGEMPLPPYIARARPPDRRDRIDYQTVYACRPGAVAAPTAGLHFDESLLAGLAERGVRTASVTLHVGGGTFLPVRSGRVEEHRMEPEWGVVGRQAAARVAETRRAGGRVVAVGTTTLRLLEAAARGTPDVAPFEGDTDLFIYPGFAFRAVDALLTNFHLPRSTLFMLVCAFMGTGRMQAAYRHAVASGYRFFSYGDASFLLPGRAPKNSP